MRVVAALGGNAFAPRGTAATVEGERRFAREALAALAPFLAPGNELLVTHGNGPQIGHQLDRVERSRGTAYDLPLDVCVAQTQGELGYVLAQALRELVAEHGGARPVAALVTQVEVDPADPAFGRPSKPIGPLLGPAEAESLRARGAAVGDDSGHGLRRLVPSPEPRSVLEVEPIRRLLGLGAVVVAGGGGGVPLVRDDDVLRGVEAVVDKDLTSWLLADLLDAHLLAVLTDVPCACTDFRTPRQAPIGRVPASRARALLAEGHFAPGSMGPKMEACARFASRAGRRAIVCDPPGLPAALRGEGGTIVVPDGGR
jgi:carbamate kinase